MIGVGIIGAGRMGQLHAQNFAQKVVGAKVVAVADNNQELALELAREFNANAYKSYQDLLTDQKVDAVCVCTPVFTHKKIVLDALEAQKHVLCEKPLALSMEDAEKIYQATENSNRVFQLAFMRRFDDAFMEAKEKIKAGFIGKPVYIRSSGRDPGLPPVPGWGSDPDACGDISFELCSHDYDSIQWLMESDIKTVYARAAILSSVQIANSFSDKMINDTLVVTAEFKSGALASIDGLLNIKYGYDARVEVVGDEGIIIIGGLKHIDIISGKRDKWMAFPTAPSFTDRFAQAYVNEANHFINCILTGQKPRVGALEGLKAVKVALAVNESIKKNLPVNLS
ncbi:scyllo-inositol 2-dehydrogenase (NAD(+)) [Moorella thermoacetica]|uniref:Gfo/Idh/MocA family oxidoreductase n=1 Tax=Neomoorella thermoacetica TaxID=1525 RepID=UPI0008FA03F5|nr:Gfo/Idh/MocA family oxidoreductase [Moorella thermoacetica]OIQ10375.1 scyllo-inositol 2-dehydrogenase [Moorella thermoacetica]